MKDGGILDLFTDDPEAVVAAVFQPTFHGFTFDWDKDHVRLSNNLQRVLGRMLDGLWYTERDLRGIGGSECKRRVRQLRELGFDVEAERIEDGLWKYRLRLDKANPDMVNKILRGERVEVPPEAPTAATDSARQRLLNLVRTLSDAECESVLSFAEGVRAADPVPDL